MNKKYFRATITSELKEKLDKLCEKEDLTSAMLLEKLLLHYQSDDDIYYKLFECIKEYNEKIENLTKDFETVLQNSIKTRQEINEKLPMIKMMLTLLIKANENLPTTEYDMKKIVEAKTRFMKYVEPEEWDKLMNKKERK